MNDFLTVVWALRWVIAAAAVMVPAAVVVARHNQSDRQRIAELAAERRRARTAEARVETLQRAVAAFAYASTVQDTPAAWINDGSHL